MDCSPGEIYYFSFPSAEMDGAKDRPALILLGISHGDFLACMITTKKPKFEQSITISPADLEEGSLVSLPSHVRPLRLTTVNPKAFRRKVGKVNTAFLERVRAMLKAQL